MCLHLEERRCGGGVLRMWALTDLPGQAPANAQDSRCLVNDLVNNPSLGYLLTGHLLLAFHTCLFADTTCPQTALSLGPENLPTHVHSHPVHSESSFIHPLHLFTHARICSSVHPVIL